MDRAAEEVDWTTEKKRLEKGLILIFQCNSNFQELFGEQAQMESLFLPVYHDCLLQLIDIPTIMPAVTLYCSQTTGASPGDTVLLGLSASEH